MMVQLLGETAEQPWARDVWVCCDESVVSSWESPWAPLGQVNMPAAFLEHSKPQTPIPLTHIINFQIAAQIKEKQLRTPQSLLWAHSEVSS